jgi:hypothetical protein
MSMREPSPPPAIRRNVLIRHPDAVGGFAGLPEHVDGDAASGIPIAADAEPARLHFAAQALGDADGAVLVKAGMVAVAVQEELQRFGFDDFFGRHIIYHQVREIRLAGDRAEAGKFRADEAHEIALRGARVGDIFQHGDVWRGGQARCGAKLIEIGVNTVCHVCGLAATAFLSNWSKCSAKHDLSN